MAIARGDEAHATFARRIGVGAAALGPLEAGEKVNPKAVAKVERHLGGWS